MQTYFGQAKACTRHLWFYDRGMIFGKIVSTRIKTLTNKNLVASRHIIRETASVLVDVLRSKMPLLKLPIPITNQDKQTMAPWGEQNARAACLKNNLEFKFFFFKYCNSQKKNKKHRQEYLHNIFIDRQLIYSFTAYFLSEKCVSFFCCFRVFREASCLVRARLIARVFLGLRSRGLNFLVL